MKTIFFTRKVNIPKSTLTNLSIPLKQFIKKSGGAEAPPSPPPPPRLRGSWHFVPEIRKASVNCLVGQS